MTMMTMLFHLEKADDELVWWVESPDVVGFYAAAPTLVEVRHLVIEALRGLGLDGPFIEKLALPNLEQTERAAGEFEVHGGATSRPESETASATRVLVSLGPTAA